MKPPKSWLDEYAAKKQPNEGSNESSKTFKDGEDNSFRHYMGRKIELQRNQFGLVLPPDPASDRSPCEEGSKTVDKQSSTQNSKVRRDDHFGSPMPSSLKDSSKGESPPMSKSVRFDEESFVANDSDGTNPMKRMLNKLKRKHGLKGSTRKLKASRKRKRHKDSHANHDEDETRYLYDNSVEQMPRNQLDLSTSPRHDSGIPATEKNAHMSIQNTAEEGKKETKKVRDISIKKRRKDLFFYGVVVLVNGYTEPSADVIMRDLHKHGGDLEKYETNRVTHIIAQNLSSAKANIYKKQKKPTPVVRPQWIVDCVQEQRLLPHAEYILNEVRDDTTAGSKSVISYYKNNREEQDKMASWKVRESRDSTTKTVDSGYRSKIVLESEYESPQMKLIGLPKEQSMQVSLLEKSKENYPKQRIQGTVGTDRNFLESYFNHSRLSFIGSFKQRSKKEVKTVKQRHQIGTTKFVFHIDMDCFFASVAIRKYPQFRDKPVAVGHATNVDSNGRLKSSRQNNHAANSNSELSTCNYTARKFGVKKGMFLRRALSLCPDLIGM